MAEKIQISNKPSQSVEFNHDGNAFTISLATWRGYTIASVVMNGDPIIIGIVCVPNEPIIPTNLKTGIGGNFRFNCKDDNYPYFTFFNQSQSLEFVSDGEL